MAKILVIDDDEMACKLAKKSLERNGHTVLTASNGRLGLQVYSSIEDIELVITDILMPDQDGIGVIIELRHINKDLPVIAISGGGTFISSDFLQVAKKLGAAAILKKPCTPDEIRNVVDSVLGY